MEAVLHIDADEPQAMAYAERLQLTSDIQQLSPNHILAVLQVWCRSTPPHSATFSHTRAHEPY